MRIPSSPSKYFMSAQRRSCLCACFVSKMMVSFLWWHSTLVSVQPNYSRSSPYRIQYHQHSYTYNPMISYTKNLNQRPRHAAPFSIGQTSEPKAVQQRVGVRLLKHRGRRLVLQVSARLHLGRHLRQHRRHGQVGNRQRRPTSEKLERVNLAADAGGDGGAGLEELPVAN